MRPNARTASLLSALCLVLPAAPATASDVVTAEPVAASTVGENVETFNVTLDWVNNRKVVLPPVSDYWRWDPSEMSEEVQRYYDVFVTEDHRQMYVKVGDESFAEPWKAPSSFSFHYHDAPYEEHTYLVNVTVTGIPTEPTATNPDDIAIPEIHNAVSNADLGRMWDGGHPIAGYLGGGGYEDIYVTAEEQIQAYNTEVFYRAHPLNAQMSKYFRLVIPGALGNRTSDWAWLGLGKRKGAPALPARYWEEDWFEVDYTVFGKQHAPSGDAYREFSVERTVEFGAPTFRLVASSRTLRYEPEAGYTTVGGAIPGPSQAHGLRGGTLRFHLFGVPKEISSKFEILLRNPRRATRDALPTIGVRPKTTRAARTAKPFTIRYRASAVNRAGVRVYSAPATYTFRRL